MADKTMGAQEGALKAGADAALAASASIRRTSDQVQGEVENTRSRWVGLGADEFRSLMSQWDEKTESMVKVLDNLAEALGATEQDRAAQEDTVSSSAASLNSAMSGI
jgi:WXG100 family type VII secretion target